MHASAAGHAGIVRLLVDSGADTNVVSNTGHTTLDWARLAGAQGAGVLAELFELGVS